MKISCLMFVCLCCAPLLRFTEQNKGYERWIVIVEEFYLKILKRKAENGNRDT